MSEPQQPPQKLRSQRLRELVDSLGPALEIEDVRLVLEAAQTAERLESGEGFNAKPIVSMRDGRPYIDCSWMGMLAQVTPDQARSIGLGMIQTAAEAESDAAAVQFFKETGVGDERAVTAVAIIRNMRSAFQEVVGEKQEPPLSNVIAFGSKPS